MNILENVAAYLPIRGRMNTKLEKFLYPYKEETERKQNLSENKRDNIRLTSMMELIEKKMAVSYANLKNDDFLEHLTSFTGLELQGDKERLLNSYEVGKREYHKFIYDRVITRRVPFKDTIKKCSIPVFKLSTEVQKKTSKVPNALSR